MEWIPWSGAEGECKYPVERGTIVDVKYRDGVVVERLVVGLLDCTRPGRDASGPFWRHDEYGNDIVAWRPTSTPTPTPTPTRSSRRVEVDAGALQMILNALRRDAEEGRPVRGEMADELLATAKFIN